MAETVQKKSIVKKWWFWVIVVAAVAVIAGCVTLSVFVKSWPSKSDYAKMLPKPDFGVITEVEEDFNVDGDKIFLWVKLNLKKDGESNYKNYIKDCQSKGFDVDAVEGSVKEDGDTRTYYFAKNTDGYTLEVEYLDWQDGSPYTMSISITDRDPAALAKNYEGK